MEREDRKHHQERQDQAAPVGAGLGQIGAPAFVLIAEEEFALDAPHITDITDRGRIETGRPINLVAVDGHAHRSLVRRMFVAREGEPRVKPLHCRFELCRQFTAFQAVAERAQTEWVTLAALHVAPAQAVAERSELPDGRTVRGIPLDISAANQHRAERVGSVFAPERIGGIAQQRLDPRQLLAANGGYAEPVDPAALLQEHRRGLIDVLDHGPCPRASRRRIGGRDECDEFALALEIELCERILHRATDIDQAQLRESLADDPAQIALERNRRERDDHRDLEEPVQPLGGAADLEFVGGGQGREIEN